MRLLLLCLPLLQTAVAVLIPTPFGMRHKECIIEAPSGATVDENATHLIVTDTAGVVTTHLPHSKCTSTASTATLPSPHFPTTATTPTNTDPSCNSPPCTCNALPCNNWIDNAGSMDLKQIIGGMSATYLTPQTPHNSSGQTLFYFIGAENTNGTPRQGQPPPSGRAILQPVLTFDPAGWCANSTTGWCFSSWYCCPKNLTTHSPYIVNIEPGDLFLGSFNISTDGKIFSTLSQSLRTGEKTILKSPRQGRNFNWADITQEVYNMQSCQDFASSPMEFHNVTLWDDQYQTMVPHWLLTTTKPCGGSIRQTDPTTFSIEHDANADVATNAALQPTALLRSTSIACLLYVAVAYAA